MVLIAVHHALIVGTALVLLASRDALVVSGALFGVSLTVWLHRRLGECPLTTLERRVGGTTSLDLACCALFDDYHSRDGPYFTAGLMTAVSFFAYAKMALVAVGL